MFLKKIILAFIFSQIYFLGVFGLENNQYYVIQESTNICGSFTKGTAKTPNWLQSGWEAVNENTILEKKFIENINCESGNIERCCKENGYKYAGIPIGSDSIGEERAGAEYLASKGIIEAKSYAPSKYMLEETISRKEVMKVIMNISGIKIDDTCREIFVDVPNDWSCKYIESALDNGFIASNSAFRPDDTVTQSEALKLIFQASNISKRYNTGSWQEDYISTAYYLGFISEKFTQYNIEAKRGWIFQVASASLK